MTAGTVETGAFEQLYTDQRDVLYKALVLATDDRDLSLDAVDGAFVARRRRLLRQETAQGRADILRRSLARVRKRGSDGMRGFRLPGAAVSSSAQAAVGAVRSLDLTDRMVVIADAYLGWEVDEIAAGVSLDASAVALRLRSASTALAPRLGVTPDDVPGHLARSLDEAAAGISVPLSRLESVRAESTAQRILLGAGGLLAVAALAGIGVGVWNALDREPAPPGDVVAEADGNDIEPEIPMPAGGATVEWEQSGTPLADTELNQITSGPEGFVAVGFNHNENGSSALAMRSESGFDWETTELPTGQRGGGWVASLAHDSGRYVAVATGFDNRTGMEVPELLISEDGEAWDAVSVPVESEVVVDDVELTVSTSMQNGAVRGDRIVILGSQYAQMDIMPLIRDSLPEGVNVNNGWDMSQDGIALYDNAGNLTFSATYEELGLSAELASFFSNGRPVVATTDDGGESWEQVTVDGLAQSQGSVGQIALLDEVMVTLVYAPSGGAEIWTLKAAGDDTWVRADLERGFVPTSLAGFGDTLYITGSVDGGAGSALLSSTNGVDWTEVTDPALGGMHIDRVSASTHGLLALGAPAGSRLATGPAVVEKDGLVIEISETGLHHVKSADGESILEAYQEDIERAGRELTIVDPETGEDLVTLTTEEIDLAWQAVWSAIEAAGPSQQPLAMALTRDGSSWTVLDTGEAIPPGFVPIAATLGPRAVMLSGWVEGGNTSGPTLLVGTFAP